MIILKKAQATDLVFLEGVHLTTIHSIWTREDFLSYINSSNKNVFIILENELSVGFIMVDLLMPEAEIINVAVLPEKQSVGIGTEALRSLIAELSVIGITNIFLEVRENSRAVDFYSRNGFESIGVRKNYYPDGENALRMLLCLPYSKMI